MFWPLSGSDEMKRRAACPRKFFREDKAAAMVEFAIVVPILLLLAFGIIDYGRFFFTYNNLTNAAREGARFLAVQGTPGSANAITACQTRVTDLVVNLAGTVTGTVTCVAVGASPTATVEARIAGQVFTPIIPLVPVPATFPVVRAVFRQEFQ